jgi:hypothetical protein
MFRALLGRSSSSLFSLLPRAAAARPALALALAGSARAPAASYATTTRRRRKELRKDAAAETRRVLNFARLFDPVRVARAGVFQTLSRLGWAARAGERVGEDLVVDFALEEWAVAFEVVPASAFRLPGSADASDDAGWGAGVVPPADAAAAGGRVVPASATPYGSAPAPWLNPVRGLLLDAATAARHAAIRARGWKLVVVAEPLWAFAASAPARVASAHYARRDLLMSLVLPLEPFEARPPGAASGRARGKAPPWAAGQSAAAAAASAKAGVEADMARREGAIVEAAAPRDAGRDGAAGAPNRNRRDRTAARAAARAGDEGRGGGGADAPAPSA